MSTELTTSGIVFGDGTVQNTKTPTNVSAFANNSAFMTTDAVSSLYPLKSQVVSQFSWSGYYLALNTYNVDGGLIQAQSWNCNCNC